MYHHNWQNSGVSLGRMDCLRPFKETPSPWANGSRDDKVSYCQRQIDRIQRWRVEEDSPELKAAVTDWIRRKQAVLEGAL